MQHFYKSIFCLCLMLFSQNLNAQQSDLSKGIEFYEKGDFQNAILVLNQSKDIKELHYLGLSYEKTNQDSKAKDVHKKVFEKSYEIFFDSFIEWEKIAYTSSKKPFSDLVRELETNNQFGLASAERAYSLKSDIFQSNEWRIKAKVLLDLVNLAKNKKPIYSSTDDSVKKFKILEKPRAEFPKDSSGIPITPPDMRVNLAKTIKLFAVFGSDGELKLLMPTDKTINSLTISSMTAAGKIKFNAGFKDSNAVSIYARLMYSFTLG